MVVSGLVLLVSVVCVASAPMDVETKVRPAPPPIHGIPSHLLRFLATFVLY